MKGLTGTYLGQYYLKEIIGEGGMAVVYRAYQETLDRYVAVKILPPPYDEQFEARFKQEARALAKLQHEHILPIYDFGEQQGLLYFVLQYVEGGHTLSELTLPLKPMIAVQLTKAVLAALDHAHKHGIIHRDVKPSNVLLPPSNKPLLADFGIARFGDHGLGTLAGLVIGTVAYIAPEQAEGRPIDSRADLYSLGVMLYELVTGRLPFVAESHEAVLRMHLFTPPPPPRSINPNLPDAIEKVLLRALAKDPNDRYQSAAEMSVALEQAATEIEQTHTPIQIASLSRVDERDATCRQAAVLSYEQTSSQLPSDIGASTEPRTASELQPHSKLEMPIQQLDRSNKQRITVDLHLPMSAEPPVEQAINSEAPTASPSQSRSHETVNLRFFLLLLLGGLIAVVLGIGLTFLFLR